MAKKRLFLFLFIFKILALAIFLVVLGTIVYFLLFSPGKQKLTRSSSSSPNLKAEDLLVEQQIGLKFVEFRGDQGRIEIKAQRHVAMKDGLYRLEGDVLIHDFGKHQGLESWMSCQEAQYDQDWHQVIFLGEVKVKRQGLELEAEKISYQREAELMEAEGKVKIKFKKISGQAENLIYFLNEEKLKLSKNVKIEFQFSDSSQPPFKIEGQNLFLERKKSWGRIEGQVRFSQGNNFGEANWLEFSLTEDEQFLRHVEMGDQVRGQTKIESMDSLLIASSLKIKPFLNSNRIHLLEAYGNSSLEIVRSKERISFVAETLRIVFNRWGGLREIQSEEQARWWRKDLESGEEQEARAESINYLHEKGYLIIRSPKEKKAYLGQPGTQVTATEMTLNVETQDLESRENVQFILQLEKRESEQKNWLLASDKPLFGFSQALYFSFKKNWLLLDGEARLWQESFSLQANRIVLRPDSRELEASDQVKMIVIKREEAKSARPQQVIMLSPQLEYWPEENHLVFKGPAEILWADFRVKAQALEIDFQDKSSDIDKIKTEGEVNVVKGTIKAKAERGYYDWAKDIFVLEGKPILEDPERGLIRGDKLTFNLAESRILVENQGRERSISIIKK